MSTPPFPRCRRSKPRTDRLQISWDFTIAPSSSLRKGKARTQVRKTSLSHELLLSPGIGLLLQVTKAITAAAIPHDNSSISPITYVRHLVGSTSPNDKYLLLCLLETAEPRLWAGIDPQIPAVLDAFEVELIMQQLDSPDSLIRTKVCNIIPAIFGCL